MAGHKRILAHQDVFRRARADMAGLASAGHGILLRRSQIATKRGPTTLARATYWCRATSAVIVAHTPLASPRVYFWCRFSRKITTSLQPT